MKMGASALSYVKKNTSFQVLTDNFSSYCKYYKWFMHVYYLESQYHDKVVTKGN